MALPIQFINDSAKINFNSEFYSMYSLSEVCERFQHMFKMTVEFSRDKKQINVYFKPKIEISRDEFKEILLEFLNHTIHEEVSVSK